MISISEHQTFGLTCTVTGAPPRTGEQRPVRSPLAKKLNLRVPLLLPIVVLSILWDAQCVANAQRSAAETDIRGDLRRDRQAVTQLVNPVGVPDTSRSLRALLQPEAAPEYTFSVSGPLTYTTNAAQNKADQGTWHGDPEITLDWARQLPWVKISARLDADFDRYINFAANDSDTTYGFITVSITDGQDPLELVPYFGYRPTLSFTPTFAHLDSTVHDLYVGFSKKFSPLTFNPELSPIASSIDLRLGRRLADPAQSTSTFVTGTLSMVYNYNSEVSISIKPTLRARWYDEGLNAGRRDFTPNIVTNLAYAPAWLNIGVLKNGEIDFTLQVSKNISNRPARDFSVVDVGPSINFSWQF